MNSLFPEEKLMTTKASMNGFGVDEPQIILVRHLVLLLTGLTEVAADPSLSPKAIKYLNILVISNPFPLPDLIATWAELLHANVNDVTKWLAEHRSPVRHLPTPVSTSPEPASEYQYQWAIKADPTNSPIIPSPSFCSTHAPESHGLSDQQLIDAISEASRLNNTVTTIPTTLKEFESMFEPYRARMETIIQQNEAYLQP
ncbi:hypothetical protein J132_02191 [Termitomyces sp. J132]|nr:hypothetical protein C0989_000694 [Termitomyces sp. Mn162]KNZ81239.1 hypothetical protein J132_02191 [Termitomyces sp. J132]